jgi:2-dehydro-3-deoxygluconokinase
MDAIDECSPAPYVLTFGETMALMRAEQVGPLAHASTMSPRHWRFRIQRRHRTAAASAYKPCGADAIGADSLGQLVEREIRAEGVDVRIAVDPSAPTGLMIKERSTPSTQRVSYYRAMEARAHGSARQTSTNSSSAVRDSCTSAGSRPHSRHAGRGNASSTSSMTARTAGVPVSFDLNYRGQPLVGRRRRKRIPRHHPAGGHRVRRRGRGSDRRRRR